MKKLIDAHKFFCRKSQHYMMGNWAEYEKKAYENDSLYNSKKNLSEKSKQYLYYRKNFLKSYIKFMYLTIKTK